MKKFSIIIGAVLIGISAGAQSNGSSTPPKSMTVAEANRLNGTVEPKYKDGRTYSQWVADERAKLAMKSTQRSVTTGGPDAPGATVITDPGAKIPSPEKMHPATAAVPGLANDGGTPPDASKVDPSVTKKDTQPKLPVQTGTVIPAPGYNRTDAGVMTTNTVDGKPEQVVPAAKPKTESTQSKQLPRQ